MKGVTKADHGIILSLWVQPSAKKTEIAGHHGEYLKIRLNAPPVDGKANQECLRFIASILCVKKGSISLMSGMSSRYKRFAIIGITAEEAEKTIKGLIKEADQS